MNKQFGVVIAVAMLAVLGGVLLTMDWDKTGIGYADDVPENGVEFTTNGGSLSNNSINYVLFEDYGPLLLVLGGLMFGAIIAGVCISREEEDSE